MPRRRHYVDVDLSFHEVRQTDLDEADGIDSMAEARLMVGIPLALGLSVFGGVSAAGVMSWDRRHPARDLALFTVRDIGGGGDRFTMKISPGLFAGVAY
jgi:hypothetical protein